jgi:uncharacterized protein (TIGR02147 family)
MGNTSTSQFLAHQLEQRCQKNPHYSLRAFARDLAISPAMLSQVMNGSKGLSRKAATQIATHLGLNKQETRDWVTLVESLHSRSKKLRAVAKERLKKVGNDYTSLDAEAFRVIADWYHLALLALVETDGFQNQDKWIARRLGLSIFQVREAITRLKKLEMLEETPSSLRATGVFFANPAGTPSQSIRSFHSQILKKAENALLFQPTSERDFSALVIAVDVEQIDDAKKALKEFREQFEERFCSSAKKKKEVYALSVQFFRLTETLNEKGEGK